MTYTDINGNFDTVYNEFNGNIDNSNIKPAAAIAISKIATGLSGSVVGTSDSQTLTNKTIDYNSNTIQNLPTALMSTSIYAPQGFLLNGTISVSVSSSNITIAIKGMDGNDPSSTNKVYIRIGDTVRTLTAALSVTKNAGTNWFNSGATGLATNEIDYFVYLGYNATDGVVIGFARFGSAQAYSDFNATSTNEKYCAISTITNAAATDNYENIGRFAATLSATASFNWSVPTFTPVNLIQRPILDTRQLTFTPTLTGVTSPSGSTKYWLRGNTCFFYLDANGTGSATTFTTTVPFSMSNADGNSKFIQDNTAFVSTVGRFDGTNLYTNMSIGAWTASGTREWTGLITGTI